MFLVTGVLAQSGTDYAKRTADTASSCLCVENFNLPPLKPQVIKISIDLHSTQKWQMMRQKAAFFILVMLGASPSHGDQGDRVKQATDVILKLCIAGGVENVEIRKQDGSIHVGRANDVVQIDRRE